MSEFSLILLYRISSLTKLGSLDKMTFQFPFCVEGLLYQSQLNKGLTKLKILQTIVILAAQANL